MPNSTSINTNDSTITKNSAEDTVISEEISKVSNSADDNDFVTTSAYVDRIEQTENGDNKIVLYTDDEDNPEKFVLPASMLPDGIKPDDFVIVKIAYDAEKSEN